MSVERDEEREYRIMMEAVVDAHDEQERAMGWYYYLDDKIAFPFKARCISVRRTSPLKKGEAVKVTGMAPEDECLHEIFVQIQWKHKELSIPLAQLEGIYVDDDTEEALGDWHYWVTRGYQY